MSSTIYNKGFSVELSHNFYETVNKFQIHRYLDIAPTEETAELMGRGRMRFVRTDTGLTVFYKAYEDSITDTIKPLVELTGPLEFMFTVKIREAQDFIQNVTNLNVNSQTYNGGNVLFLGSTVNSFPSSPYNVALSASLIRQLRPSVFTYSFLPDTGGFSAAVNITVKREGAALPVITVNGVLPNPDTGTYSIPVDLREELNGIYTIKAVRTVGGQTEHEADVYVDAKLATQHIFGLVRVKLNSAAFLYQSCVDSVQYINCQYAFLNRSTRWRYYIGIKDPGTYFTPDNRTLKIVTGATGYVFTPAAAQPTIGFSIGTYADVVVFTSTTNIPFKETPITQFQLQEDDNTPVIGTLANAGYTTVNSNRLDPANFPVDDAAEIFLFIDALP